MKCSVKGKQLIKKYEGCRLVAYKAVPSETYWTIGWGHYGADVAKDQRITQKQADILFDKDLEIYEQHVRKIGMTFTQNQFDALVSFCYNCGARNLQRLCNERTIPSISKWITAYNKSGGKILKGLVRRREEEKGLFDSGVSVEDKYMSVKAAYLNIRREPHINGEIIGVLKKGQLVQVIAIDTFGWAKIHLNDEQAYVSSIYLK